MRRSRSRSRSRPASGRARGSGSAARGALGPTARAATPTWRSTLWSRAELARAASALFIAVLILQSCAAARGPTLDELRNATITSLPGGAISLREGVFEAARRRVVLLPQPLAVGHLGGVRGESSGGLFSVSEGGTGH